MYFIKIEKILHFLEDLIKIILMLFISLYFNFST